MNKHKKQSGQSLIELILAIMLMTVAMTSGALLVMRSVQLSEVTLNRQKAIMIAQSFSEYIKKEKEMKDWLVFKSEINHKTNNVYDYNLSKVKEGQPDFSVAITLVSVTDKEVQVNFNVIWNDLKGDHILADKIVVYK